MRGEAAQKILERNRLLREEGLEDQILPSSLLDSMPDLFQDLVPFWTAFIKINNARQWSQGGPCAISLSEVDAYCRLFGISDQDDREELLHWVQLIDWLWLEAQHKKSSKASKSQSSGGKPSGVRKPGGKGS